MKKLNKISILLIIFLCLTFCLRAEEQKAEENEITFENLQTPDSPGFVLLGISPTSVSRPGSPTDLAFTILSNTNYLSTIPKNFSIDFSPYWIFAGKNLSYDDYRKENPFNNILHSLSLSIATNTVTENEIENTSLSFGVRCSIIKGNQTDIDDFLNTISNDLEKLYESKYNPQIILVPNENISEDEKDKKLEGILNQYEEESNILYDKWKKNLNKDNARFLFYGFKWDMAGGIVIDFPGKSFDEGEISKWGIWTTFGYETKRITGLVVGRILKNVNGIEKPSIDLGGRLIFDTNTKVSFSGELLARFNSKESENNGTQWRYIANLEYTIGKNRKLGFSIGRDFKGTTTGNLIAMINLIFGIGSSRPVPSKPIMN